MRQISADQFSEHEQNCEQRDHEQHTFGMTEMYILISRLIKTFSDHFIGIKYFNKFFNLIFEYT